jgi:hypothetical protein
MVTECYTSYGLDSSTRKKTQYLLITKTKRKNLKGTINECYMSYGLDCSTPKKTQYVLITKTKQKNLEGTYSECYMSYGLDQCFRKWVFRSRTPFGFEKYLRILTSLLT